MSQVEDVVRDALGHLGVIDADQPINALDMRDSIRALNTMMARWSANGMELGWSPVEAGTDPLPAPPEAEEAIGYNLAVRLRARYRANPGPDVFLLAEQGLSALRRDRMVEMPLTWDREGNCYDVRTDSYR
jgi:hypothetical protein